ncbi:MAG TPA: SRPBCC family protein [Chloroflexota bacterium]|nr:SRPBCC family protein [Chloroflexota bacterium]
MGTLEEFTYIDAPPALVYHLLRDLANQARYFPRGMKYRRALTAATDVVGARVEIDIQVAGPFWRSYVVQLHAVEEDRALVIGTPDAATLVARWRLDPEPPGTLATVTVDFLDRGLLAPRFATVLRRHYRALLQRLRALAEEQRPPPRR